MKDDVISRQQAIDALWKALYEYEDKTEKQFIESGELDVSDWIAHRGFVQNMSDIDRQTILALPSAQPEPIKVIVDHEMTEEELKELNKMIAGEPVVMLPSAQFATDINVGDINKFIDGLEKTFADIRERNGDDTVCGLCEFDGAYIGESGDWCNECPGFNRDDCFKLRDKIRKKWIAEITACLPSAQRKKGQWKLLNNGDAICSECGRKQKCVWDYDNWDNFCRHCGADMRGEE